jgi:PAS domain S-box-containing protein
VWDEVEGRVTQFYATAQDITERKLAEQALRDSEERYRIVSEIISDYAFSYQVDAEGNLSLDWITESYNRVTGRPIIWGDEPTIHYTLYHPDDVQKARDDVQRVLKGEEVISEYRIITGEGETRWVSLTRTPVWDDQQQRVVRLYGIAQDITERRHAEQALRDSEERFRQIAENINEVFYVHDPINQKLLYINPAFELIWGKSRKTLEGDHFSFMDNIHPDDVEAVRKSIEESKQGFSFSRYRIIRDDGEIRWVDVRRFPIRNEDGEIYRIAGLIQDVTERKLAERHEFEIAVEREQRRVISNFVGDASHEFRTPLSIINTSVHLVKRSDDEEKRLRHLDKITEQVSNLTELIEMLVTMSHLDGEMDFSVRPISINSLIEQTVQTMRHIFSENNLTVTLNLDHDLPRIIGDNKYMGEAFRHIIENASRYTPSGGKIDIRTFHENSNAVIEIADTGIGIDSKIHDRIFERFYRADEAHSTRGFGLGLPITRAIIERHNGTISVESEPGKGSMFRVTLPTLQKPK